MWTVDHKGNLVNLDNAVWVGLVDARTDEAGSQVSLTAHMVDGSSIGLALGSEQAVRAELHALADRVRYPPNGWNEHQAREANARMRYED